MVVEFLNCSINAIYFDLLIVSCDYNISTTISCVGYIIATVVKI